MILKRKKIDMNSKAIDNVIQEGMRLMEKSDLRYEMVRIWANYSMEIMNLVSQNSVIKYQYSTTVANAILGKDSPNQQIGICLRFLISNYSMI